MHKKLPFLSVIVPVYNDARSLRRCLYSLKAQNYPTDRFEVIVIDNGSNKDDPQAVLTEFPDYRYTIETKVGSYAARNKGMSLAVGEAFAFIDSDCIPSSNWLKEGVQTLLHHPNCGFVGGCVDIFVQNPLHPTSVELHQRITAFQFNDWMEARVCGAGNMFVWAAVFLKVGPFNETLKSGGDFEWCRRVQTAGLKIVYNERMRVQHPARRTWREIIKRQRRIAGGQKFYQDFNRKQTNGRPFGLQRIINALVPKVSTIRKVCMDERLNNLSEQIRVGIVTLVLHYVWVIEVARLILGGKATRS